MKILSTDLSPKPFKASNAPIRRIDDALVVAVAVRQDVGVFLPGFNHEMQFWTKIIHWNDAASDIGDNIGLANSSGSLYEKLFSF